MKSYWKLVGLAIATVSVIAYRELPDGWYLLAWIPIHIGFLLYYDSKLYQKQSEKD